MANGKNVHKLREKNKASVYSPSEVWSLTASSSTKPMERTFVVNSGTTMHIQGKKDLSLREIEIVQVSRNSQPVEMPTHEETTDYVHDLDFS